MLREANRALVEFKDSRAVKVAVHLHNCILGNKKVKVHKLELEKQHDTNFESLITTLKKVT